MDSKIRPSFLVLVFLLWVSILLVLLGDGLSTVFFVFIISTDVLLAVLITLTPKSVYTPAVYGMLMLHFIFLVFSSIVFFDDKLWMTSDPVFGFLVIYIDNILFFLVLSTMAYLGYE